MGKVKWAKYVDDYLKLKEKGYGCNVIARELGITKSLSKKLRHVTNSEISDKYLYKKYSNQDISNLISCIIGDGGLFIPKDSNSNCYGKISHIGVNYDYLLYKYNTIKDFSNKTHRGRKACKRKVNNKIVNCKEEFVINIKASPYNKLIYDLIYVDGKKAITKKSLEYFNDMTLAMLYFDDGSYIKSSNTYRIAMGNMEVQYIELFQNWLKDKYNINTTRYNTYGYYSIYIRRDSHNNLENVLKQYLVPSMEYKIKGEVKSDKLLGTPEEDNQQPITNLNGQCGFND